MSNDNELVAEGVAALARFTAVAEMTPERIALVTGMVIDMTLAIAPMITAHFEHLRMDTPEDEMLREQMVENLGIWNDALDLLRVHPLPDRGIL